MELVSTRKLESLKQVLQEPNSSGPNPVYKVFSFKSPSEWANNTVIKPGKLGREYTKTFGHYHTHPLEELYKVESGEGVLLLQKKHIGNGEWNPDIVDEVLLIRAKAGDEILITPEYGHSWSNIGNQELVLLDNWNDGHVPQDYEEIEKHQGMAYYITEENGIATAIPNPTYKDVPVPQWVDALELQQGIGRLG
ncbi:MAG: hypothetical protein HYW33_04015 [Candidatus Blackburnbacteria bacterium]|nr:hypothetical protein [Candidatus Blackburnbacteria bacterium]